MENLEKFWKKVIDHPQGITHKLIFLFLYKISILYQLVWEFYLLLFKLKIKKAKEIDIPVISIGNLTVGGTGKTSLTLSLAQELNTLGYKPAILLRGYKGKNENQVIIVSDGENIFFQPKECGDEAYFLAVKAKNVPVLVGRNRVNTSKLAQEKFGCNIILIDDGFQYLKLKKDLEIILLDVKNLKNLQKIFPAGVLREKLANLKRAQVCILTRVSKVESLAIAKTKEKILKIKNIPIFYASYVPTYIYKLNSEEFIPLDYLLDKKVLAFCGIGNPESFFDTIKELTHKEIKTLIFSDHCFFTEKDIKKINHKAQDIDLIITTEKDAQRLITETSFSKQVYVLTAELEILKDKEKFNKILKKELEKI